LYNKIEFILLHKLILHKNIYCKIETRNIVSNFCFSCESRRDDSIKYSEFVQLLINFTIVCEFNWDYVEFIVFIIFTEKFQIIVYIILDNVFIVYCTNIDAYHTYTCVYVCVCVCVCVCVVSFCYNVKKFQKTVKSI